MSERARVPTFASVEAFLAWERRQELRYEFDGFGAVAMTGGTMRHQLIGSNLDQALRSRLHGGLCRSFRDAKVVTDRDTVRYPDAAVTCAPHVPLGGDSVPEPVVVSVIISRGTDRIAKTEECGATRSIRRYVLLEQEAPEATVFARGPGGDWAGRVLRGSDAVLELPEIGIALPLAEIYDGAFDASDPAGFAEEADAELG